MLDWEAIAAAYMHPAVLLILKAINENDDEGGISPTGLVPLVQEVMPELTLGAVSYHVRELAKRDLIWEVRVEPRRGALEHFYCLSELAVAAVA